MEIFSDISEWVGLSGRISRLGYLVRFVTIVVCTFILAVILANLFGISDDSFSGLWFVLIIIAMPFTLSTYFRRFHDRGLSGGWFLLGAVPLVGFILPFALLFWEGQKKENKYGLRPQGLMVGRQLADEIVQTKSD